MAIPRPQFPDQELFRMEEACRLLQLPHHTLRYWEERVPQVRPARLSSGHRRYTRQNLETLFRLKELMKDRRMTLAGARRALAGDSRPAPARDAGGAPLNAKLLRELREDLRSILAELAR
ncbi:MAG: MerR family transcriptional regulator [Elusimicrobia bacterium]|nr:MerR family transcriptional regulator [Elusimicrobiota bacterium]